MKPFGAIRVDFSVSCPEPVSLIVKNNAIMDIIMDSLDSLVFNSFVTLLFVSTELWAIDSVFLSYTTHSY